MARLPYPILPPSLRQDLRMAWKLSLRTLVAGTGLGSRDPSRSIFGCLGSQYCLLIEQEKAKRPSGASECHLNQPDSLRTGFSSLVLLSCVTLEWGRAGVGVEGRVI